MLARRFREVSDQLRTMTSQLGGQVHQAWWQGTDADRFRADWDGQFTQQLNTMCVRLDETATLVTNQANNQRQASAT